MYEFYGALSNLAIYYTCFLLFNCWNIIPSTRFTIRFYALINNDVVEKTFFSFALVKSVNNWRVFLAVTDSVVSNEVGHSWRECVECVFSGLAVWLRGACVQRSRYAAPSVFEPKCQFTWCVLWLQWNVDCRMHGVEGCVLVGCPRCDAEYVFFVFSMKYRFCSSWAVADIWFDCSITIECGRGMDYDEMIFYWWFLGPFYQRFKDEQRRSRVNYWCRSRTNKYDVKCTSTRVLLMSMEVNEPSLS